MAETKNTSKAQREKQLAEIARLYLRGITQAEIGEQIGVSQRQVSYDLAILRERWKQSSLIDFDAAKAEELAKIDALEAEYWQAWNESKREKKRQAAKKRGEQTETSLTTEERNGDPRYLQGVQWCIEQRCKILEIGIKVKSEQSGEWTLRVKYDGDASNSTESANAGNESSA